MLLFVLKLTTKIMFFIELFVLSLCRDYSRQSLKQLINLDNFLFKPNFLFCLLIPANGLLIH
jgi:predicted metal-binding protein